MEATLGHKGKQYYCNHFADVTQHTHKLRSWHNKPMRNVWPLTKCFTLSCIPTAVLPTKQDPREGEGKIEWKSRQGQFGSWSLQNRRGKKRLRGTGRRWWLFLVDFSVLLQLCARALGSRQCKVWNFCQHVRTGVWFTPDFQWRWAFQEATLDVPNVWHVPARSNQIIRLSRQNCCWAKKYRESNNRDLLVDEMLSLKLLIFI